MALKGSTQQYSLSCKTHSTLTPKRQRVLDVLVNAQKPLSAYEIVERYNEAVEKPIHAMSVYRILEFLKSVNLIAHLHSVNKFLAQGDPEVAGNSVRLYVTCQKCCGVQILTLDKITATIQTHIQRLGYQLTSHSLEVSGLCENCGLNTITTFKES